jgi:hypothetical protein
MEDVDKEISEMKLSLNARARIVAESYLVTVSTIEQSVTIGRLTPVFATTNSSLDQVHTGSCDRVSGSAVFV